MMKGLKTVRYDDLTEEQMLAARRRRQREVSRCVLSTSSTMLHLHGFITIICDAEIRWTSILLNYLKIIRLL